MGRGNKSLHRLEVELRIELEPHGSGSLRGSHQGVGVVPWIVLDRCPSERLHRQGRRPAKDHPARRPGSVKAVEEESAPSHQLHGIDPGRSIDTNHPAQQLRRISAHVTHGGDSLGQEVAQIERQLLTCASMSEEQQMDMAIDQAGDQPAAGSVDDPGSPRDGTFPGRTRAENAIAADQGDRIGDRTASGTVPQGGADNRSCRLWCGWPVDARRTTATGAQDQRRD
jgi:hypothetical protein